MKTNKEKAVEFLKTKGLIHQDKSSFIINSGGVIFKLEEMLSDFAASLEPKTEPTIPANLDEALSYLETTCSVADKIEFMECPERKAITQCHMSTGMNMRNNWGLWDEKSPLNIYFNSIGIFHADDMSSIILTSFHRKLNNVDLNVDKQVKYYQAYWAKNK